MKAQYSQMGKVINYKNTTEQTIFYNDVVTLGARIGVAAEDIASGNTGSVQIEGIYLLPAAAEEIAVGDTLYLSTDDKVTKTAGDVIAGWAVAPKASAEAAVAVKINDVLLLAQPAAAEDVTE